MITSDPLSVIETLPYDVDCDPRDRLLVAGIDDAGHAIESADFPLSGDRPLDEAVLTITGWSRAATGVVAVAYTDRADLDVEPIRSATHASGRSTAYLLRAGLHRWRDVTCSAPRCCPRMGNRYPQSVPGHAEYRPLPERTGAPQRWRAAAWDSWQEAIREAQFGQAPAGSRLAPLARALFDIPLRDAVLAQSARDDGFARPAMRIVFSRMLTRSTLGTAIPAFTCAAALAYLDGETTAAHDAVNEVLAVDEYSLARLLRNGLEMRAPASLLARSFSHFDPVELLAA